MEPTNDNCKLLENTSTTQGTANQPEQVFPVQLSMPLEHYWLDSRYYIQQFLGEGAFGSVFLVYDDISSQNLALKIPKSKLAEDILHTEISIMERLARSRSEGDNCLLHLCGHSNKQGVLISSNNEVISENISYILTPYVQWGDLATHIINNNQDYRKGLSEDQLFSLFKQLLDGVEAMHQKGFVHLDLKPDNILIRDSERILISDFALAKSRNGEDGKGNFFKYRAGSQGYWSPEMHSGLPYNGTMSDLYALGVILFILTFGTCPFQQASMNDYYFEQLVISPVDFWKIHPETSRRIEENTVSPDLVKLINLML